MTIKEMRTKLHMSQQKFGDYFNIPLRTIQRWEYGKSVPPAYTVEMIQKILVLEGKINPEPKYPVMNFSGRHERISLHEDGSFDILFIIKNRQYAAKAQLPREIDISDIKWYCRSIASDYRNNKIKKIIRNEW
ncbi:MAG: helix-turn-helix domain-containing protein [Lachnospiraceae bacterium]|nr:helix-turn-helix domain-containing protein [Lachnospiraceae bacterium]